MNRCCSRWIDINQFSDILTLAPQKSALAPYSAKTMGQVRARTKS